MRSLHISLYRKYRPQRFGEVVGQSAATSLLRQAFVAGRLGHAYLFSGPRGCGKTTAARLVAKIVNCEHPSADGEPCCECASCIAVASGEHLDVMEIDAASNRGIDDIRALRENVALTPMMGNTRVYILDEVHMLSDAAFNALLKTLEEPPSTVMFVLATTDPNKVPVTIRSRCQHIPFHRISVSDIAANLRSVASSEKIAAEDEAIDEIARAADGAMRDALSFAEQVISFGGGITSDGVAALFGGASRREMERWISLLRSDPAAASASLADSLSRGASPESLIDSLFPLVRDLWIFSLWGEKPFAKGSISEREMSFIKEEVLEWTSAQLEAAARAVARLLPRAKWGLKSEIFAGLMVFDLLAAREGRETTEAPARQSAAPTPRPSARAAMRAQDTPAPQQQERPRPRAQTQQRPAQAQPSPRRPLTTGGADLPSLFSSLDTKIAAALIDAVITVRDGEMSIDTSGSTELARYVLELPRTRIAIERALGLASSEPADQKKKSRTQPRFVAPPPPEFEDVPMPEFDDAPVSSPAPIERPAARPDPPLPRRSAPTHRMTPEEMAAYIGADLLVKRPITSENSDETEDISEEI